MYVNFIYRPDLDVCLMPTVFICPTVNHILAYSAGQQLWIDTIFVEIKIALRKLSVSEDSLIGVGS